MSVERDSGRAATEEVSFSYSDPPPGSSPSFFLRHLFALSSSAGPTMPVSAAEFAFATGFSLQRQTGSWMPRILSLNVLFQRDHPHG